MRWVWHLHHETLLEPVGGPAPTDSLQERKAYVRRNKSPREVPLRLKYMRIVKGPLPAKFLRAIKGYGSYYGTDVVDIARATGTIRAIRALHRKELPNSPWRGRGLEGNLFAEVMYNHHGIYVERKKRRSN